jgi:transposase
MLGTHPPYPAEYRRRIAKLARARRTSTELAREFEASANTIRKLVKQAALDEGLPSDGLTSGERTELNRLRRENRVPGSQRIPARCRHGVPIRERESGQPRNCHDVPGIGCLR